VNGLVGRNGILSPGRIGEGTLGSVSISKAGLVFLFFKACCFFSHAFSFLSFLSSFLLLRVSILPGFLLVDIRVSILPGFLLVDCFVIVGFGFGFNFDFPFTREVNGTLSSSLLLLSASLIVVASRLFVDRSLVVIARRSRMFAALS
jgi:hypothetical protein